MCDVFPAVMNWAVQESHIILKYAFWKGVTHYYCTPGSHSKKKFIFVQWKKKNDTETSQNIFKQYKE